MFIFHRIGWKDDPEHSGWWLYIDTEEQLKAYFQYNAHDLAQVWFDIKDSPNYKEGHCRTSKANAMKAILNLKMEKEGKSQMSMVDCVNWMENEFNNLKVRIFLEEGAVYINSAGGCHSPHLRNDHKGVDEHIYEVHENEDLIFPVKDDVHVVITQWPMCPHYYLSVNGKHVEVDGIGKWNTIEGAESAKEVLIKRLRRKKKK